ncbi:hypothetical protein PCC7418_3862 [Halothece sp. PCC 7418]|uniref:DUF4359 domain-containing protein n=1 Tax=Halothece sp. (strain PCC 7418) TaxID=65093 RepID=UPI0002A082B9|nr:DUF4359 domain-containing protein [Halothece sp. PCC 7418]AFZ45966.1 hypothetical protein PCC7418_3862 [Halothece sp. PCC 7418]
MKLKPWEISILISSIAVLGVGSAMAITNPRRQAYQTYAAEKMSVYIKEEVCADAPKTLGDFLERQCNKLVDSGQKPLQEMIAESTERHNYFLFSIYETNLSVMTGLPSYQFKTIGAFQNFWTYESQKQ